MPISDSCPCGATFEVEWRSYHAHERKTHDGWLAEHAECRRHAAEHLSEPTPESQHHGESRDAAEAGSPGSSHAETVPDKGDAE